MKWFGDIVRRALGSQSIAQVPGVRQEAVKMAQDLTFNLGRIEMSGHKRWTSDEKEFAIASARAFCVAVMDESRTIDQARGVFGKSYGRDSDPLKALSIFAVDNDDATTLHYSRPLRHGLYNAAVASPSEVLDLFIRKGDDLISSGRRYGEEAARQVQMEARHVMHAWSASNEEPIRTLEVLLPPYIDFNRNEKGELWVGVGPVRGLYAFKTRQCFVDVRIPEPEVAYLPSMWTTEPLS